MAQETGTARENVPAAKVDKRRLEIEIFIWVGLTVLLALMPLLLNFLWGRLQSRTPTLESLVSRGELFLVGTALAAETFGRIFNITHQEYKGRRILCGVVCVYLLVWGSAEFAMLMTKLESAQLLPSTSYNVGAVFIDSVVMFLVAVSVGISAIILSEE